MSATAYRWRSRGRRALHRSRRSAMGFCRHVGEQHRREGEQAVRAKGHTHLGRLASQKHGGCTEAHTLEGIECQVLPHRQRRTRVRLVVGGEAVGSDAHAGRRDRSAQVGGPAQGARPQDKSCSRQPIQ